MTKQYLPTRPSKSRCLLLVGLVVGIYVLENSPLSSLWGSRVFTYGIKPALWLGLAGLVLWFPRVRAKGVLKFRGFLNWWAFNFAFILIGLSVTAGLFIDGLGKSPYNHSLTGITLNFLLVGSVLLGTELVRHYLVNSSTKEENYLA